MNFKRVFIYLSVLSMTVVSFAMVSPFATEVISYSAGTTAQAGYDDASMALGRPSVSVPAWPSGVQDVTMFASAWETTQLVSIGASGSLVVKFDHQVADDIGNPFGLDLLIFGNENFFDADYPNGFTDGMNSEPGGISVSQNGIEWYDIAGVFADGPFPTQAYINTSTAQGADGTILSDFTLPVDPSIAWDGKSYSQILALYNGSGGGTGVDISSTGLGWIQYVKVEQNSSDTWSTEIDAFADVSVPEPVTIGLLGFGGFLVRLRRGRFFRFTKD